jgi:hypothetical protein
MYSILIYSLYINELMNNAIKITIMTVLAVTLATTMILKVQPASAIVVFCHNCAKDFAPGQEAKNSEGALTAKDFAPGQEAKIPPPFCIGCDAKDFAPGQEKKITK